VPFIDFESRVLWGVLDLVYVINFFQWLATDRWFSPVSSTYKTDSQNIAEILLKVGLNSIALLLTQWFWLVHLHVYIVLIRYHIYYTYTLFYTDIDTNTLFQFCLITLYRTSYARAFLAGQITMKGAKGLRKGYLSLIPSLWCVSGRSIGSANGFCAWYM